MKVKIEKSNLISSLESWYKYAAPEGGASQWVDGRSAKEFARYMLSETNDLPNAVTQYLETIGFKGRECKCYPEQVTDFPSKFGTGSGRHHDALLISSQWLVGIEAKVSESFDAEIKDWLKAGEKNNDGGANRRKRVQESLKLITGKNYSEADLKDARIEQLRYQLISATVGTIIEAQKKELKKACLLIIEFGGDVRKEAEFEAHIENNAGDYNRFLDFLQIGGKPDKDTYVTTADGINVWFKRIHININQYKYESFL